jgi:hypothetical protein
LEKSTGFILTEFLTCQASHTAFIKLKTSGGLTSNLDLGTAGKFDDFIVQLQNLKVPIAQTPGILLEYTINSGFIAFNSAESNWS